MTAACCASACAPTSCIWRIRHPAELCYWLGGQLSQAVVRRRARQVA